MKTLRIAAFALTLAPLLPAHAETFRHFGHVVADDAVQVGHKAAQVGRETGHAVVNAGKVVGHDVASGATQGYEATKRAVKKATN